MYILRKNGTVVYYTLDTQKMRLSHSIYIFLTFLMLFGCSNEWKDGPYSTKLSPEDPSKITLYIDTPDGNLHGRVEFVERIGSDSKFIIVQSKNKQFWIIEKSKDAPILNANEIVIGPMLLDEFKLISFKMKINKITLNEIKKI